MYIKRLLNITFVLLTLLFLVSCNTIHGYVDDGPLINHNVNNIIKHRTPEQAINFMVTSISMTFPPIANQGNKKPKVINNFTVANSAINDMQMEVWRKLKAMQLIDPALRENDKPDYKLISEIKLDKTLSETKKLYLWNITLKQISNQSNKEWKTETKFEDK